MKLEVISRLPEGKPRATLLFVHGAWHGAWCWEDFFMPYFQEAGYAAYALSLRGHGQSGGTAQGATTADYAQDLLQVVMALDEPPILIGHSMGGYVIQKYLENYPAEGAVLMASVAPAPFSKPIRMVSTPVVAVATALFGKKLITGPRKPETVKKTLFTPDMPDELVEKYAKLLCGESMVHYVEVMAARPLNVNQIKRVPILIQTNAHDTMQRILCNEKTVETYGADHQIFYNTAHDMMLGVNWKEVADGILTWLEKRYAHERIQSKSL
jgi:pimeloyl-ACP methyl ester carboxylesterase